MLLKELLKYIGIDLNGGDIGVIKSKLNEWASAEQYKTILEEVKTLTEAKNISETKVRIAA